MTTTSAIDEMLERYRAIKASADSLYREAKEIEWQMIACLREKYPEQWSRFERGIESFKAEGIEIPISRTYDTDKFRAEFGEGFEELITRETKVVEKVNGRAVAPMWKRADYAERLARTIVTQVPKLKIKKERE